MEVTDSIGDIITNNAMSIEEEGHEPFVIVHNEDNEDEENKNYFFFLEEDDENYPDNNYCYDYDYEYNNYLNMEGEEEALFFNAINTNTIINSDYNNTIIVIIMAAVTAVIMDNNNNYATTNNNNINALTIDQRIPTSKHKIACFYKDAHTFNELSVDIHVADSFLNNRCKFCNAFYSDDETIIRESQYTTCCQNGKVKFSFLGTPVEEIRTLLDGSGPKAKLFQRDIRRINTVLGFSSTTYKERQLPENSRGPPILIIEGNIMHQIGTVFPNQPQEVLQYMQSYFWEPQQEALQEETNIGGSVPRKYYFAFDEPTVSSM